MKTCKKLYTVIFCLTIILSMLGSGNNPYNKPSFVVKFKAEIHRDWPGFPNYKGPLLFKGQSMVVDTGFGTGGLPESYILGSLEFPWQNYITFKLEKLKKGEVSPSTGSYDIIPVTPQPYESGSRNTFNSEGFQIIDESRRSDHGYWILPELEEGVYCIYATFDNTSITDPSSKIWKGKLNSYNTFFVKEPKTIRENAMLYEHLGVDFITDENYSAAKEMYEKALKIDPTYRDLYYSLGVTCRLLGQFKEALSYLEEYAKDRKMTSRLDSEIEYVKRQLNLELDENHDSERQTP